MPDPSSMRLTEGERANFETLLKAADNGDLALVSTRVKATGRPVALICAMQVNDDETISPIPFGELPDGNPFEIYEDPTEE